MSIDGDINVMGGRVDADMKMHKMILSLQEGMKMILEKVLNKKVELEYDPNSELYKWNIL